MEKSLAEIFRENYLDKKYLIVPRLILGHQILESVAKRQSWINVEVVTPASLARNLVEVELIEEGKTILEPGELEGIIEEILLDLHRQGDLRYFSTLQERESLASLIFPVIRELRMSGIDPANLNPDKFVDPAKGKELGQIFRNYLAKLEQKQGIDDAGILKRAIAKIGRAEESSGLFLIPEDLEVFPLEKEFLQSLKQESTWRLRGTSLEGRKRPPGFFYPGEKGKPEGGFSFLFAPENNQPSNLNTRISPAYGATNEVRGWLREFLEKEIPLDSIQFCYTSGEKYIPLIWNEVRKLDILLTLGEGLPAAYTRPGRLLLNLIEWAENGYPGPLFYRILTAGDLELDNSQAYGRLFRRAAIGWGKDWYLRALEKLVGEISGGEDPDRARHLLELARQLTNIFTDPRENEAITLSKMGQEIRNLLPLIVKISGPMDALALEAIENRLERFTQSSVLPLSTAETYSRLRKGILQLNIGASRAEPGAVHATHYRWGQWSDRPYTIVLGMDSDRFPGRRREDPLLLDRERELIGEKLALRWNDPERKQYRMARLLASRSGFTGFSFERFDPGEGRNGFPAAFLLQVYRKKTGNPRADYTEFLGSLPDISAYSPGVDTTGLSGDEWWLKRVLLEGFRGEEKQVEGIFEGIKNGLSAENLRQKTDLPLGQFEGKISLAGEDLPARYSATRLETMATCPFKFFLESILRISPPEEVEYDPLTWLDPLTRGSLLHDLYRDYVASIPERGMTWERLKEMGENSLKEMRKILPPPHEHVYLVEQREFLQGLRVFWKMLNQQVQDYEPLYVEVPFGLGDEAVTESGWGFAEPVVIKLPAGKEIKIVGRIDRIDRRRDQNIFRIWDYKTGGASRYSRNQVWAGGRQIQPALYARAAEEFLQGKFKKEEFSVERAGYLFPSERGEGQEVDWSFRQEELVEILEKMVSLIEGGTFPVTHQKEHCRFCDYPSVCRYPESGERIKAKLEEGAREQLRSWKELSEYE